MCLASNIARRKVSAAYYARIAIPSEVQAFYPRTPSGKLKSELWKSLGTKDAREAKARVHAVLDRWQQEFAELRRRLAAIEPTEADLSGATWDHYQTELERHQLERRVLPDANEISSRKAAAKATILAERVTDPIAQISVAAEAMLAAGQGELNREFRAGRKAELERHLPWGEFVLVADVARDLIRRENYAIEEGSPEWRDLCHRLLRAELEGLRRAEEQDRGDYTGTPRDPIVRPPASKPAPPVAAPGEGIVELFDVFATENPRSVKADTLRMNREIVVWFSQHVGATFPASSIDKKAVREWKAALAKFPIKAAEVRELRGLSFQKIVTENENLKRPTLSDRTINKYLSALGAFCAWLVQNGHIENNPVTGMHLGEGKDRSKIVPYSAEQLTTIFHSPLFTGCLADGKEHKPGHVRPRDHRYWLPLMAMFTGARMGELAQLLTADVRQERGRWIFHVTREGDAEKTTKTKGSQRVIPVHPELERLGFLTFHAERTAAGDKRLFPEIRPDARGQLAGHYSRFFGRYVKRIGVKSDASLNFHSFRHGFMDALRRARYRDEAFQCLIGHVKASTTGRYGILTEGDLTDRCEMIDAVSFPGLDLAHLY